MVKTFETGGYIWIYPNVEILDKALKKHNRLGGLDTGFLANCRPDVSLAYGLWNENLYRFDCETDPEERIYKFPDTEVSFVIRIGSDGRHYITSHNGLTLEQYGAMLLGYSTKRYLEMTESEFEKEIERRNEPPSSSFENDFLF
jgi:hypothetical protein